MDRRGVSQSDGSFQQALALDPEYPPAIVGLSDSYAAIAGVGVERDPAVCESMFEKAIRLDPEHAEAHGVLGIVQGCWMWKWREAQQRFETAMGINPRDPHVLQVYSFHLALIDRFEEAIALGTRAVELDPLMPFWNAWLAAVYHFDRRYEEGVRQAGVRSISCPPSGGHTHSAA